MIRLLSLLCALATPAAAQLADDIVRADLIPGQTRADGTRLAGLSLALAPGWKTYWRSPGDAGIPPLFDWTGSGNLSAVQVLWPVPAVFSQNGIRSIGYHDRVVLPLVLHPSGPGDVTLTARVEIGVCQDVCVPVSFEVSAVVPAGGDPAPAIVTALADRPMTGAEAGLTAATCAIAATDRGIAVTARVDLPDTGGPEAVAIEAGDPRVWVSEPQTARTGGILTATAEMVHVDGGPIALDRSAITITVLGRDRTVEIAGCAAG